jgi:hypothetical protein
VDALAERGAVFYVYLIRIFYLILLTYRNVCDIIFLMAEIVARRASVAVFLKLTNIDLNIFFRKES